MSKTLSLDELRKMAPADLRQEVASQRRLVTTLRLGLTLGKEKGSHLHKRAKKLLARMLTVLSELQGKTSASTMGVPRG